MANSTPSTLTKSVARTPSPAQIKAGWDLINSDRFSPLLRAKLQARGLGVVELWKEMFDAAGDVL